MKKLKNTIIALMVMLTLLLGNVSILAKEVIKTENGTTVSTVSPYILKNGSKADLKKTKKYKITFSEKEKQEVMIPIKVTVPGKTAVTLVVKQKDNGAEGTMTVGIYKEKSCDNSLLKDTSVSLGKKEVLSVKKNVIFDEPATYYLRLQMSDDTKAAANKYQVGLKLQQSSSANKTLQNGQWKLSYSPAKQEKQYYKIKVKNNGMLKFYASFLEGQKGAKVVLCNEKKKEITGKENVKKNVSYVVNQGTYYFKLTGVKGKYRVKTKLEKMVKGGSSKSNATLIPFGSKVKGMAAVTDSKDKVSWYRFVIKKPRKCLILFQGSTFQKGTLKMQLIPPEGVVLAGDTLKFQGKNQKKGASSIVEWSEGTWYLKVSKEGNKGSGYYTLAVK